jgi:hypothetical protein
MDNPNSSRAAQLIATVVMAVIIRSCVAMVVQTLPEYIQSRSPAWSALEYFCISVFSLELALRLWASACSLAAARRALRAASSASLLPASARARAEALQNWRAQRRPGLVAFGLKLDDGFVLHLAYFSDVGNTGVRVIRILGTARSQAAQCQHRLARLGILGRPQGGEFDVDALDQLHRVPATCSLGFGPMPHERAEGFHCRL